MENFAFHLLNEVDLPALLALYRSCADFLALGPQPLASPAMVLADLAHARETGSTFYGVTCAGQLAGVLDLLECGQAGDPRTAVVNLLMLAPSYRGHGLGGQVLAWAEQRALAAGTTRLEAYVQVNNPRGLHFWLAHGFQVSSPPQPQPDGTITRRLTKLTGLTAGQ
jgi:GNAT superfamily N-acetyltransferase